MSAKKKTSKRASAAVKAAEKIARIEDEQRARWKAEGDAARAATRRENLAGLAMMGLLAAGGGPDSIPSSPATVFAASSRPRVIAILALEYADALLANLAEQAERAARSAKWKADAKARKAR